MNADLLAAALKLSPSDRLELIGVLWDTLSDEDIPVTPEEQALLDERLADFERNPDAQSSWEEVKARLEQRRR
jgi:putative addiction module component (TIGR02574 family)